MRKRNVSYIFDKCLWFLILILPLLFAFCFTISSMNNYKLDISSDDVSYDSIISSDIVYSDNVQTLDKTTLDYKYFVGTYLNDDENSKTLVTNITNIIMPQVFQDFYLVMSDGSVYALEGFRAQSGNYVFVEPGDGYTILESVNYLDSFEFGSSIASFCEDYGDSFDYGDYKGIFGVWFTFVSEYDYDSLDYVPYITYIESLSLPTNNNIFNVFFNNLNYCLDSWFTFGSSDIVYTSFNSVFGTNGLLPIFVTDSFIPKYLTYMCWIIILHLIFDFLVFIPRLAHKWMGSVYKDEDV